MFCPACGKEVPDHSGFCLRCGTAIQTARTTVNDATPWRPARLRRIFLGGLATAGLLMLMMLLTNATEVDKPLLAGEAVISPGQSRYWTFEVQSAVLSKPR